MSYCWLSFIFLSFCLYICLSGCLILSVSFLICHLLRSFWHFGFGFFLKIYILNLLYSEQYLLILEIEIWFLQGWESGCGFFFTGCSGFFSPDPTLNKHTVVTYAISSVKYIEMIQNFISIWQLFRCLKL